MFRVLAIILRLQRCNRGIAALEFVLIAPAVLLLAFAVIVYSLYFTVQFGLRQAASEGARAAMAGLNSSERAYLATTRAQEVNKRYGPFLGGGSASPQITVGAATVGTFQVTVTYDFAGSPLVRYGKILPLPSGPMQSTVVVTNGGY